MKLPAPAIWLFTLLGGFALAVTVLGQWFGLRDVYADGRPLGIVERYENTVLRREQFYDEENDSATVSVSLRLPEKAVVQTPSCRAADITTRLCAATMPKGRLKKFCRCVMPNYTALRIMKAC